MPRLPRLTVGSCSWRLPVTAWAATELATRLLVDGQEPRVPRLDAVLQAEPALALWCVCRSRHWQQQMPAGTRELATWLSAHGLHVLQWCEAEFDDAPSSDQHAPAMWGDWAMASVTAAQAAADLAGEGWSDRAYLVALLHRSQDWLTGSADHLGTTDGPAGQTCLPAWLALVLQQLQEPQAGDPAVAAAAQAVHSRGLAAAPEDLLPDSEPNRDQLRDVRQRWLAPSGSAACLLPLLTRRLARLQELETRFQRTLETEKLQALKALAYGASHEINNPLANISTRAQTLLREETDPERRRKLAVINSQAFRAHEMISDLMLFAQPPELRAAAVDLAALVVQVLEEMAAEAAEQETSLAHVLPDAPLQVTADGVQLAVALKAICRNSLEALARGGHIEISARELPLPPADADGATWAELRVHDTGPGIPAAVRQHLFDPYFSGREAGRGLGLGLSKCWRIVTEHGGRINVESEPECGTTFSLLLPQVAPTAVVRQTCADRERGDAGPGGS